MKSRIAISRKDKGGFTLIEILVSFTVLGLIMVGVAQMMNSALSATIGGYKHMDADTQARMVLDRMAFDISKIVKRPDVDYLFKKNIVVGTTPGNDQMAFYSESGGYYPTAYTGTSQVVDQSEVSLVGYMINSNNQLIRLSDGLTWNAVNSTFPAMVFNPNPTSVMSNTLSTTTWNGAANGVLSGSDPNYQIIGDQVFRLEYTFLTQTSPTSSSILTTVPYFSDSPWATPDTTPVGLKDVTAIIVTIAVLDTKSRALISNSTLQTAASYLADDAFSTATVVSTTSSLPMVTWKNTLATGTPKNLGLPQAAASQVRFYQRYCYLNHLQ